MLHFGLALTLSILAHAAVLAAWSRPAPEPSVPPRLHVQLQQPASAGAQPPPERAVPEQDDSEPVTRTPSKAAGKRLAKVDTAVEARSAKPATPSESEPVSEARGESAPPEAAGPSTHTPETEATPPQARRNAAAETPRPFILARLHEALEAHFAYPMLARRRGWEGRVLVGFRIESGGRIGDVHVARSSGYGVLDRSAVKALDRVGGLPGVETGGGPLEMTIPIIYRLQEG